MLISLPTLRRVLKEHRNTTWTYVERGLKVVGTIGTVTVLFFIYYQSMQTSEQLDAMWYSMRPELRIYTLSAKDVEGRVISPSGPPFMVGFFRGFGARGFPSARE